VEHGGSVYLIPENGASKGQNGAVELISGAMIDYYVPEKGAAETRLDSSTRDFLEGLKKGDPNFKVDRSTDVTLDGNRALLTRATTKASNQADQVVYIYTTVRQAGLWYLAQAAPAAGINDLDPIFKQMAQTLVFPKNVP